MRIFKNRVYNFAVLGIQIEALLSHIHLSSLAVNTSEEILTLTASCTAILQIGRTD